MDKSLCPICAWRADCKKKFKPGAGIHCPDFTRDLKIKNTELEDLAERQKEEVKKKPKKGLFPL
ncbi:MAG: hypothetical protein U9P80_08590 [Thermodesulfobacteriota bacterium]|nr:hypothetical protein [Thermodesulfobacteriota bacterium]